MLTLTIDDEIVRGAGLTEREVRVELACRLFDIGRLSLPMAGKLAGLERNEFEAELWRRKIPAYRPTVEDVDRDVQTLADLDAKGALGGER